MIACSTLKFNPLLPTAFAVLVLALSAASLGCAVLAYAGAVDAAPVAAPATGETADHARAGHPVADIDQRARCQGVPGTRVRRGAGHCRTVELPSV
jgi:hypothetical protein